MSSQSSCCLLEEDNCQSYCQPGKPAFVQLGNLALGTSAEDVKTIFQNYGQLLHVFLPVGDPQTITTAILVFGNQTDAIKVVQSLNNSLADDLILSVRMMDEQETKPLALLTRIT
jgi:RNA recognition motif-containing protein